MCACIVKTSKVIELSNLTMHLHQERTENFLFKFFVVKYYLFVLTLLFFSKHLVNHLKNQHYLHFSLNEKAATEYYS